VVKFVEQHHIDEFKLKGATVLRGVFSDWVEKLRAGIAVNMTSLDANARIYKGKSGGGRFFVDYCNWDRISEYKDFIFQSNAANIGAELMGSKTVQLFHEHVLVKEACADVPTPWHQDAPYYCVSGPMTISLWVPLDDVARDTTLKFVSGSHLWGKYFRPQRFDGSALNKDDGLEEIPNISENHEDYEILGWAVSAGDAIAFDYRTIHGAAGNNKPKLQRRAFSLRLVGDGTRFVRRKGLISSPPFNNITLRNGDPLKGDDFPYLLKA
jgi:ectoine hydroxylase-related dioxygenase (phytanoyl-CoA dioxygenase family)